MTNRIDTINTWFKNWIDPFQTSEDLLPPRDMKGFFWHYLRQARLPFFILLLVSGSVALIDAALFYFIGRLVDILAGARQAEGWAGLLADHAPELALLVLVLVWVGVFGLLSWHFLPRLQRYAAKTADTSATLSPISRR